MYFSFYGCLSGPNPLAGCAGLYRLANLDPRSWVAYSIKPNPARPISKPTYQVDRKTLSRRLYGGDSAQESHKAQLLLLDEQERLLKR
jgi:hypothetical protein